MGLFPADFLDQDLADLYDNGQDPKNGIPGPLQQLCMDLLDSIAEATRPEDLVHQGAGSDGDYYFFEVDQSRSIRFRWKNGRATDISF